MVKVEVCEFISDVSLFETFKKYTKANQMQVFDNKYAKSKGNDLQT